jgi:hypothetical protein
VTFSIHSTSQLIQNFARGHFQTASGRFVNSWLVYYEVATVQAYATMTAIRLVVRIPLRGADRVMTIFKSMPLPTYLDVLGRCIKIEPEAPYLAVTENREYYSLLTDAELQQYKRGLFTICEAPFPFMRKTRATCAPALYFSQTGLAHKLC